MAQTGRSRTPKHSTGDIEQFLESCYPQLLKWAALLTRGDSALAQDIVHDLCLHFTMTRPDLSQVKNPDGYLYSCLRNLYLSALARSSREANQFLSTAEYDSIQAALDVVSTDHLLDQQNDLRRICNYAVWRKESSKSASYFILIFFHAYARKEVAQIACAPMPAIYNKLKIAREEIKAHLAKTKTLYIATHAGPPRMDLSLRAVSSSELFQELRERILAAKQSECLPDDALLAHYRSVPPKPITCGLLSHIVSCERCLALIDHHFRRPSGEDRSSREIDLAPKDKNEHPISFQMMMRSVRRERERIYEHRPQALSIAVNGKTTASHDVQGEQSTLSSRIEQQESARFVEVFNERQVRLALISIEDRPPEGPHIQTQRIAFSDDRWLEVSISFDGQGIESEAVYFDPALAPAIVEDEDDGTLLLAAGEGPGGEQANSKAVSVFGRLSAYWKSFAMRPALAWTFGVVLMMSLGGYFTYRITHPVLDATAILNRSVKIESAWLAGQTEHQLLAVASLSNRGKVLQRGTVELWKDATGARYSRRLYDEHQKLLAAEWKTAKSGTQSWTVKDGNEPLLADDLWKQDLSPKSFEQFASGKAQVSRDKEGYAISVTGPTEKQPHLVLATLILDRSLHPVQEILRLRMHSKIEEMRYVVRDYERRPSASVPDSTFLPSIQDRSAVQQPGSVGFSALPLDGNIHRTELQISVLYALSRSGADSSEPLDVSPTPDGHIRVVGAVRDEGRRRQILSRLNALPDHERLDLRIVSQADSQMRNLNALQSLPESVKVYNIGQAKTPAEDLVRNYLVQQGLSGDALNTAVAQFSSGVMKNTQLALQHAYALDRLGKILSTTRPNLLSITAKQQWAEMVEKHTQDLETELAAVRDQLTHVAPAEAAQPGTGDVPDHIDDPDEFAQAAHRLLQQVQEIDHNIGAAFAYRPGTAQEENIDSLLEDTQKLIPIREAGRIGEVANRLAHSERAQDRPFDGKAPPKPR